MRVDGFFHCINTPGFPAGGTDTLWLQGQAQHGDFSFSYGRCGLRLPSHKNTTGWTYFLKGLICLPKKVKGTTEFHFNGPCYCSMTLASIWYWASVMVLRDSWVIFWEVEYFQKEVWKTSRGLWRFPRVGSIDLVPLSSLTLAQGQSLCPKSQEELCCSQLSHLDLLAAAAPGLSKP